MSKILKSFGMAALLVALLAGTGMAENPVDVTGCYFPADYLEMDAALLVDTPLGVLPTGANGVSGGSVAVDAGGLWKLEVIDTDDDGKMKDGTTELYNKFQVNQVSLVGGGSGEKTIIKNDGVANTACTPQTVDIRYDQAIRSGEADNNDVAGDYSIELTVSVAART